MSLPKRILFKLTSFLFKLSFFSLANPNIQNIITNSENTRKRIRNYLKRNAKIVYPPINTKNYASKKFGDYWLSVNRIYPAKRLELQLETFRILPRENLVIVGAHTDRDISASYNTKILSMTPDNVSFVGRINANELANLYANCRGFIVTALDEDFGMAPVEAMASGKAVVAVNEGGFRETIINGKTGFLVNPNPIELAAAVKKISKNPQKFEKACFEQAEKFGLNIFLEKMYLEIRTDSSYSKNKFVPAHSEKLNLKNSAMPNK
ncbi:MAG: glycosyltransferase [Thaumarchaeota archaeon]|nr:glycosyltransferase [Nitrososphaerota archaeon]